MAKTRIFAFCNTPADAPDEIFACYAMSEHGPVLAMHICSSPAWGPHDLGVTLGEYAKHNFTWKHDEYAAACPEGFEVEWVPPEQTLTHPGLAAAFEKNQELARKAVLEATGGEGIR